jgi:hypothetical protein
MNMDGFNVEDDPESMWNVIQQCSTEKPLLLNVNTIRLFWHAGAGIDDPNVFDRHKVFTEMFGNDINLEAQEYVKEIWSKCLQR